MDAPVVARRSHKRVVPVELRRPHRLNGCSCLANKRSAMAKVNARGVSISTTTCGTSVAKPTSAGVHKQRGVKGAYSSCLCCNIERLKVHGHPTHPAIGIMRAPRSPPQVHEHGTQEERKEAERKRWKNHEMRNGGRKEGRQEGRKPPTRGKQNTRRLIVGRILRQPTLHLGVVLEGLVWCAGKVEVEPRHPPVVAADDQVVP